MTCYNEDGIEGIKRVLIQARDEINNQDHGYTVSMRMISSPLYDCSLHTTKKSTGLQIITDTLNEVQKRVNESSSNFIFKIVEKPEALGSEREKDIESIIQNMTQDQDDD